MEDNGFEYENRFKNLMKYLLELQYSLDPKFNSGETELTTAIREQDNEWIQNPKCHKCKTKIRPVEFYLCNDCVEK